MTTRAPRGDAPANMSDVAREAGVSIATVSRALRGLPGVSPGTRERILQIADQLAYVVSPEASSLSRGATGRVAIVVPRLDSWFASTMTATLESTLRGAARDVLLYQVAGQAERHQFFRELPTRRKVDAVVLVSLPILPDEEERLDLMGVEVVVAGARLREYPFVEVDDVAIGRKAVEHLVGLGHERIAMIRTYDQDGADWTSDIHRHQGYSEALAAHGLAAEPSVVESFGVRAGARAMDRLLDLDRPPTAVFCCYDELAVGARQAALQRGLRVPEDLSLIGVDGNPTCELFDLTTIDQHVVRQARIAGEMALALLAGEPLDQPQVVIESELVKRSSTAPAPAG